MCVYRPILTWIRLSSNDIYLIIVHISSMKVYEHQRIGFTCEYNLNFKA